MADWDVINEIDYSPNGDDIDTFSQKVKAEEGVIYQRMNRVRANDAGAGTTVADAVPWQWRIDTSTEPATIFLRDGQSNTWKRIGRVDDNFGIDTSDIGGVANKGGITSMQMGKDVAKPASATLNDLYFAYDSKKVYRWQGTSWEIFLSLDYDDIQDKEESAVSWDDVATQGANKIVQFNGDGDIDANITGYPAKLENKEIVSRVLQSGDALVYDGTKWENRQVATVDDGMANVNISGNAAKVASRNIVTTNLDEGDALVFDGNKWANSRVAQINNDGLIQGSITGNAARIAGVSIKTDGNISDGQVLVYRSATNTFVNENKGSLGPGAAISFKKNGEIVSSYDGSEPKEIEMELAVCAGEELPDSKPLHFVEIR